MVGQISINSLLGGYRALDLTTEAGFLCGRILGDMGADVIKIEKPGGDQARNIGPFYHDMPEPEKSLYWLAYNSNKRGITLNIETADGQEILRTLVKTSDFIIDSFPAGYMSRLGLGYDFLSQLNPGIIMLSITPFGQTGPYCEYASSDITVVALSGVMGLIGDPQRPPLRMSLPQSFLHAAAEAATAALVALHNRALTGEGQYVDVAMQASLIMVTVNAIPMWLLNQRNLRRTGAYRSGFAASSQQLLLWPCKDGFVAFYIIGGAFGAKSNRALAEWMVSEGMADDFIREVDWDSLDFAVITQETQDHLEALTARFFMSKTKQELYEAALERGVNLCPLSTAKDQLENSQLKARDFWVQIEHPEIGATITYPGAFAKFSETPLITYRRAPHIGEHNEEIYINELGMSRQELLAMKQSGVI